MVLRRAGGGSARPHGKPSGRRPAVRRHAQPASRADDRRRAGARARLVPADVAQGRRIDPLAGAQAARQAHAFLRSSLQTQLLDPIMNTPSPLLTGLDLPLTPRASLLARLGRRLMVGRLAEFSRGELRVVE